MPHRDSNSSSEDEEEKFVGKIRSLKQIAVDLTSTVKAQTRSIRELEPGISRTLHNLRSHIERLQRTDPRSFRIWAFYLLTSLFFLCVLFILFFLF
ncbi:hypothetical protein PAPHI01_0006 [Pancytospora philotis]|nr:hypothetical protein PAPHI01_0006 [Pancytospora philotis]